MQTGGALTLTGVLGAKALIHFGLLRGAEAPLFHGATGFSGGKTMKVKVYTRFSGKRGTMEISMDGGRDAAGRGGRDNTKHRGVMAEMQFMLDAAKRGFGVAKPFGDNERYDVILDATRRLWRVHAGEGERGVASQGICGAGVLEDEYEACAVHQRAN